MEVNTNKENKIVEIWLNNSEKNTPEINAELKKIYAQCKRNKYTAAVFLSGEGDLFEGTRDLLLCNRNTTQGLK